MNKEYVICNICNKKFQTITNSHLKKHNLTIKKYVEKYPNSKLRTESSKKKTSLSNINRYKDIQERINTGLSLKGVKRTEEQKLKYSKSKMGRKNPMKRKEVVEKMIATRKRKGSWEMSGKNNPFYGKKHTEATKAILREKRKYVIVPKKDTSIEVKMQKMLDAQGSFSYEKHKPIMGQPDIFIEPNICVFCDGDYWHSLEKAVVRDKKVNKYLKENGYIIVRLTEHKINENPVQCLIDIIKAPMREKLKKERLALA